MLGKSSAAPLFCADVTVYTAILRANISPGQYLNLVGCGRLGSSELLCSSVQFAYALLGHIATQYAKAIGYRVHGCRRLTSIVTIRAGFV